MASFWTTNRREQAVSFMGDLLVYAVAGQMGLEGEGAPVAIAMGLILGAGLGGMAVVTGVLSAPKAEPNKSLFWVLVICSGEPLAAWGAGRQWGDLGAAVLLGFMVAGLIKALHEAITAKG